MKVFDIVTVQEVVNDHLNNKGTDMKIDDELTEFFDYDIVILPFFVNDAKFKRCCLAVIEMKEEATYATLWDRERLEYSGDQINELNSDISYDVQVFLERAHLANAAEFDIDKLGGEEQLVKVGSEIDMITAVMQLAEAIVVDPDNYCPGQIEQMRHKIVDRIVSLHL